jgi:hypothetical protein
VGNGEGAVHPICTAPSSITEGNPLKYILADDGVTPVPADAATTVLWRMEHPRTEPPTLMKRTEVAAEVVVETVFVGRGTTECGVPAMWVTTVSGGLLDGARWNHPSAAEAEHGHGTAVAAARRCRI